MKPNNMRAFFASTMLSAAFLSIYSTNSYGLEPEVANPNHIKQLQETGQCPNCNLRGADLKGLDLYRANSGRPFYREHENSGIIIRRASLNGADLSGADLSRAILTGADLRGANLSNAKLGASLLGADLRGANLSNADLRGAVWIKVKIDNSTKISPKWRLVWEIVNIGVLGRDLSGMDLEGAVLVYDYTWRQRFEKPPRDQLRFANFSGANLRGAVFTDMDLEKANLSGTNLQGANLQRARLTHANFTNADLKDAVMNDADISYANFKGAKNFPVREATSGVYDCGAIYPNGIVGLCFNVR